MQQPHAQNPPANPAVETAPNGLAPPPYYQAGVQPPPYKRVPSPTQPQNYQQPQVSPFGYGYQSQSGAVAFPNQANIIIVTAEPRGIRYGGAIVVPGEGIPPPNIVIPNPCIAIGKLSLGI